LTGLSNVAAYDLIAHATPMHAVHAASPPGPYAVRKNYLSSTVKRIRLTFLSNVVAYPCRHSRKRIGTMGIFFSVILSAAKDLIAACHGHEILRCAQDDNSAHPRPATKVSATRVSRRPSETSETPKVSEIAEPEAPKSPKPKPPKPLPGRRRASSAPVALAETAEIAEIEVL
jgi:hypothetical protein